MTKFVGVNIALPKSATAPASPAAGDMYYNTTSNKAFIYDGTAWADLTGVTSIAGTANQITASASTGSVTLSLPQSIATTSTPSFSQTTLTGGDTTTATDTASLNLVGYNQRGGSGYHGFLDVKNTFGTATNPKKFFRLNSTGSLEIVNNAYSAVIFAVSDSGNVTASSVNRVNITSPATSSTLTIADGKTLTANNTLTFTGTDSSSVAFGTGGTVLYSGGALGTPSSGTLTNVSGLPVSGITSSTTQALGLGSIELGHATDTTLTRSAAGVLAVEGVDVVTTSATQTLTNKTLTSPSLTTPTIGVASATSINKVAITAPATSATLTIADGKTLTANNTLTLTGVDSSSVDLGNGGSLVPAGVMQMWMGLNTSIPTGWLLCNGQAVSRTTYATLFAAISTRFGTGDGSTTFNVPNLDGHMVVGFAGSPGTASQTGTGDAYLNATWDHNHIHSHSTNPAATASGAPSTTVTSLTQTGATSAGSSGHTHTTDIAATTSDTDSTAMSTSPTQKRTRVNYIIKW